jgi:peptidoglycan/LPS O-acetylase OafA/YrhL
VSGAGTAPERGPGLRYAPGLDGVRALAVGAVLVYHLGTTGDSANILKGGYLGVDVFFVLSGYLITSLLIVEARGTGRISIKRFYVRRAKRLFPAVFTLLAVVALVVIIWLPDQGRQLRSDLLAAVGYSTNWWLIFEDASYFGTGERPRLLTHLWSLSVEEQFYLLWPLVMIFFARRKMKRGAMLTVLLLGVAASTAAGILLYDPWSDPSRVYFGTDTRALAPLLGAALAIAARPWRYGDRQGANVGLDVAGVAALAGLGATAALLADNSAVLYRGGFLGIAALGAVLVLAAGHPGTALGQVLGTQPMRWLGERSYAIYLWHWPVFVLTRPGLDVSLTGWGNVALRVGLTLILADLSYRLIERPIRKPGYFLVNPKPAHRAKEVTWPVLRTAAVIVVSTVAVTTVTVQLVDRVAPAVAVPVDDGPATTIDLAGAAAGPAVPSAAPSAAPPPASVTGKPPTVAIFGDSQGMTLMANKPSNLGTYLAVTDATIEGCGVLTGRVTSRTGEKRDLGSNCSSWLTKWASNATRLKPRVAFVMIGAWEMFDLTINGSTLAFGSPEWNAQVSGALEQGIDALRAAGSKVALALTPCYRPVKASAGFWPERGEDTRSRHLNTLLTAAAAADPQHVTTVEPPPQFCTDPAIATSRNYRWDGVHYYKPGAALYFKAVIPQLQAWAR